VPRTGTFRVAGLAWALSGHVLAGILVVIDDSLVPVATRKMDARCLATAITIADWADNQPRKRSE